MKRVLTLLAVLLGCGTAVAQNVTIKGKVIGADDGQPIPSAYVIINASEPDVAKRTNLTDMEGNFSVVSTQASTNITISFIGYKNFYRVIPADAGKNVDLGTIRLSRDAIQTDVAEVRAQAPIASMRGDTLQYNASAFKTNPDASSEDLLKKLPGVTTSDDGEIEVHGQTVGKVYVDGKEFFADDPAMALKNLPADVIENMQIFDDQSDEAKFSGFDDGERIKAINIVTKAGVSTSVFGKAIGGYGTDDRYLGLIQANIFNGNQRWTIVGQRNNVNNQGFTLDDIGGSRRGGYGGSIGGSDASQFTTNVRGGIQTTTMGGLNYQGDFGQKLKVTGSYLFNNVNAEQHRIVAQNYISMPRDYYDTTQTFGYNYQHRFSARMEWNPNETNRVMFTPRVTYSTNHGTSFNRSLTLYEGLQNNTAHNRYGTDLGTYDAGANLYWMHRFGKPGRTLSVGTYVGGNNSWGDRSQLSEYGSRNDLGIWEEYITDQIGTLAAPGFDINGRITYAEALSASSRLQWSYNISYSKTDSERLTYDLDPLLEQYLDLDEATSSIFRRNQTRQRASMGYNLVKDKIVLNASMNYQYTTLNDDETYPRAIESNYNFDAWLPRVRFEFKPERTKTLVFEYNRNTSTPRVSQLQDILDITNPLQVYYGNPNLKQSYTDQLSLRYNTVNTEKSTNFNFFGMATFTQDYIANHRRFLTEDETIKGVEIVNGAQVSTPVNLDGYIRTFMFTNYSFRINPLSSNMNIGARYGFSKTPSKENNMDYMSRNHNMGLNLSITSNISENVDFTVAYRPSLSLTKGSTGSFDRYIRSDLSGFLNVFLWKGLFINADATWRNTTGTQASYAQHYALVNAGIGYKFLKYRQAEIRVSGNDLLNQNRSFWQTSNDTYIQTTLSQVLPRYFMVSFTYKFDTRKGRTEGNYGTEDRGGDRRGPGGPPPGGMRR